MANREKIIAVRLTEEEWKAIAEISEHYGHHISSYVRWLIKQVIKDHEGG